MLKRLENGLNLGYNGVNRGVLIGIYIYYGLN